MPQVRSSRWANLWDSLLFGAGRGVILLLPAAVLFIAAARSWESQPWVLVGGLAFQMLIFLLTFLSYRSWNQPIGPSIVTLYLTAVAWLWFGDGINDWFTHLCKGGLI